jgi:hypothetical protein
METTYRLNTEELSIAFVQSLKTLLPNQDIEITVKTLSDADTITDQDWVRTIAQNPAFTFLHEEAENIYSITDGTPLTDEI